MWIRIEPMVPTQCSSGPIESILSGDFALGKQAKMLKESFTPKSRFRPYQILRALAGTLKLDCLICQLNLDLPLKLVFCSLFSARTQSLCPMFQFLPEQAKKN